jgi:hypothetical protein
MELIFLSVWFHFVNLATPGADIPRSRVGVSHMLGQRSHIEEQIITEHTEMPNVGTARALPCVSTWQVPFSTTADVGRAAIFARAVMARWRKIAAGCSN